MYISPTGTFYVMFLCPGYGIETLKARRELGQFELCLVREWFKHADTSHLLRADLRRQRVDVITMVHYGNISDGRQRRNGIIGTATFLNWKSIGLWMIMITGRYLTKYKIESSLVLFLITCCDNPEDTEDSEHRY